jgi:small subunit ribosomal protein S16
LVKIRLARKGNRKRPFYRIVVAEEAHRRDGRFIEIVGTYDPLRKPAGIEVDSGAVLKWLSQGAQPTDTVRRILAKTGVWAHWRATQNKEAELGGMTGRVSGGLERERTARPSKKSIAKVQQQAEQEKAVAEAPSEEKPAAEVPAEEPPAAEAAPEEKPVAEAASEEATPEAPADSGGAADTENDGPVATETSEEKNG